ncbi:unnamed protein product [Symbiodinium natans]|uniref:Uncharacterized protein n=1 Tax=Symbiodinium natans TaxID=878477 RepID=A0A812UNY7_9DINO|nr:unnamed protein product [Symbiodinium natans]
MWRDYKATGSRSRPEKHVVQTTSDQDLLHLDPAYRLDGKDLQAARWHAHREGVVRLSRLISAAGRCGGWREALSVLEGQAYASVRRDACSFTSAMQPCVVAIGGDHPQNFSEVQELQWTAALATDLSMRQAGIMPDSIAANTLINAGSQFGNWPFALNIVESLCETHGALEDRRVLGLELPEPGLDRATFNSAITACLDGQIWGWALWMFRSLAELSLESDHITFTGAACACAIGGAWAGSLELLARLPPHEGKSGGRLAELTRNLPEVQRLRKRRASKPNERTGRVNALETVAINKAYAKLAEHRPPTTQRRKVLDRTSGLLDAALQSCAEEGLRLSLLKKKRKFKGPLSGAFWRSLRPKHLARTTLPFQHVTLVPRSRKRDSGDRAASRIWEPKWSNPPFPLSGILRSHSVVCHWPYRRGSQPEIFIF